MTVKRKNFEEAKAQFATIENTMLKSFAELGSRLTPLSGNERLRILHDYYRLGREDEFNFDIKKGRITGTDFRNEICNSSIKYHQTTLRMRERLEEYYSLRNIQHIFQTGFLRNLRFFRCIQLQALTWCPFQRTLQ